MNKTLCWDYQVQSCERASLRQSHFVIIIEKLKLLITVRIFTRFYHGVCRSYKCAYTEKRTIKTHVNTFITTRAASVVRLSKWFDSPAYSSEQTPRSQRTVCINVNIVALNVHLLAVFVRTSLTVLIGCLRYFPTSFRQEKS